MMSADTQNFTPSQPNWTAFQADRYLSTGSPEQVVAAVKNAGEKPDMETILVFDNATGHVVDLDLRGDMEAVLARLCVTKNEEKEPASASRGRGRPRLGVVAREVTLLPRHWEWLGDQPGGASVALRRLVDNARTASATIDGRRRASEAAYRFMTTMAGNLPAYEEAIRAFYAGNMAGFASHISSWPPDIRTHARQLASGVFSAGDLKDAG